MIIEISGRIEINLEDPSGPESVRGDFETMIQSVAAEWGRIRTNTTEVSVTEEDDDPKPEVE